MLTNMFNSGRQSRIIMHYAISSYNPARTSTPKGAMCLPRQFYGLPEVAITTLSICFSNTAQTLYEQTIKALILYKMLLWMGTSINYSYSFSMMFLLTRQILAGIQASCGLHTRDFLRALRYCYNGARVHQLRMRRDLQHSTGHLLRVRRHVFKS